MKYLVSCNDLQACVKYNGQRDAKLWLTTRMAHLLGFRFAMIINMRTRTRTLDYFADGGSGDDDSKAHVKRHVTVHVL